MRSSTPIPRVRSNQGKRKRERREVKNVRLGDVVVNWEYRFQHSSWYLIGASM